MIFEINFTYIIISTCLWLYAITNINNAIAQIDNTTTKKKITNKTRSSEFIWHSVHIFFFVAIYFTGNLIAANMVSLQYFIAFVVIHHVIRILWNFKKYPDNIKVYSMWEIYINMLVYTGTVFWMGFLWVL